MPRLDKMGLQVLGETGHHFGQYMGCARQPRPYPEAVVMVVTKYLEIALPALVLTKVVNITMWSAFNKETGAWWG